MRIDQAASFVFVVSKLELLKNAGVFETLLDLLINSRNCFQNGEHFLYPINKISLWSRCMGTSRLWRKTENVCYAHFRFEGGNSNKYTLRAIYRNDIFSFQVYVSDVSVLSAQVWVVPSQSSSQSTATVFFDPVGTFLIIFFQRIIAFHLLALLFA